jgi:hypothetical protein
MYEIQVIYITSGNNIQVYTPRFKKMPKAFSYRLYPTEDQRVLMEKTFGYCRHGWNTPLDRMMEDKPKGVHIPILICAKDNCEKHGKKS